MLEATAPVSCPVSEPAPVPKPRLELAEVMPPLPAPTFEVISERSACESAPTAPVRFLVCSSGFRSSCSRRSASSSFTWFSCFCAFSRASFCRSTGGGATGDLLLRLDLRLRQLHHRRRGRRRLRLALDHHLRQARRNGFLARRRFFGVRQQRKQQAEQRRAGSARRAGSCGNARWTRDRLPRPARRFGSKGRAARGDSVLNPLQGAGVAPAFPSAGPPAKSCRSRHPCTSPSLSSARRTAGTCRPSR